MTLPVTHVHATNRSHHQGRRRLTTCSRLSKTRLLLLGLAVSFFLGLLLEVVLLLWQSQNWKNVRGGSSTTTASSMGWLGGGGRSASQSSSVLPPAVGRFVRETPIAKRPTTTTTTSRLPDKHQNPASSSALEHRLAIVIPFRESTDDVRSQGLDRQANLRAWLAYMSEFLRPELIAVTTVYVMEQCSTDGGIFNKGLLFNAGFDYITTTTTTIDYLVFHDVDQIPQKSCSDCYDYQSRPTKLIRVTTRRDDTGDQEVRRRLDPSNVGGALMMTPAIFRLVNGYSNRLAGWGIEDDNMALRIRRHGGFRVASPGEFRGLPHRRLPGLDLSQQFQKNKDNARETTSGLSDLAYKVLGETRFRVRELSVVQVVVRPTWKEGDDKGKK